MSTFGQLTDHFSLQGETLRLISSTDGATNRIMKTVGTHMTYTQNTGAFFKGPLLVNPTCIYKVVKEGEIPFVLGKGFGRATVANDIVSKSGFCLWEVEYKTEADRQPLLIVRGIANEGYKWEKPYSYSTPHKVSQLVDAETTYKKQSGVTLKMRVSPDWIAQDPFGAITNGEIVECQTLLTCSPVIIYINGEPCASTVKEGKIVVKARINDYDSETTPSVNTTKYALTNGAPRRQGDKEFSNYNLRAESELYE